MHFLIYRYFRPESYLIYLCAASDSADRVEGRLLPVSSGQGSITAWQTIQTNPQNGIFLGHLTAPGGWYVLLVRLVTNNVVTEQVSIRPVGIGEVFIPMPVPVYTSLTAGKRVFPMAESSWGWGELGDYIVSRYNVPVAFYVTGWDGSTIDNWQKTANGLPTCNAYYCTENWVNLQPYTNLKNVLQYYGSVAGVRAILWHQGEAEGT